MMPSNKNLSTSEEWKMYATTSTDGSHYDSSQLGGENPPDSKLSPVELTVTTTSLFQSSPEAAVLGGLLLILIALAAILGNVLVIVSVYTNRKLRTITNLFVVSLAVADLMVGSLVLPFAIKEQVTQSWGLGTAICDIWISLDVALCTASILNLCCISIDRYFAITRPLVCATKRSRRLALMMIAAVWCLSAIITSPPLFGWKEKDRLIDRTCHLTKEKGYVVYSAMGSFYIPLVIMVFVYANIFVVARNAQRRWRCQSGRSISMSSSRTGSIPTFPGAPSDRPSPGAVDGEKKALRVSSERPSRFFSCCYSGERQWTEAVSVVEYWSVSRDHLRLHVRHNTGQPEIVHYCVSRSTDSASVPNNSRPFSRNKCRSVDRVTRPSATASRCRVTSDEPEMGRFAAGSNKILTIDDFIAELDDIPADTCGEIVTREMGLRRQRSEPQGDKQSIRYNDNSLQHLRGGTAAKMLIWRRHSSVDSVVSSAHAQTLTGNINSAATLLNKGNSRDPKLRHSNSLPAHSLKSRVPCPTGNNTSAPDGSNWRKSEQNFDSSHRNSYYDKTFFNKAHRRGEKALKDLVTEIEAKGDRCERRTEENFHDASPSLPNSRTAQECYPNSRSQCSYSDAAKKQQTLTHQKHQLSQKKTLERNENSAVLRERKTVKTVSIVVGCFVLCWLPFFIVYIMEPFFPPGTFNETMVKLFVWLGYFNSVINPFIYAFYNDDFRWTFWRLTLGRIWTSRRMPRGVAPSSPNNATRLNSREHAHN